MDLPSTRMWRDVDAELAVVNVVGAWVQVAVDAGEEVFHLVNAGASRVEPLVEHPAAEAQLELKQVAVRELPPQSVRSLLGAADFGRRIWFYHYLRGWLSASVRRFWDQQEERLRLGLIDQGARERRLIHLRPLLRRGLGEDGLAVLDEPDAASRVKVLDELLRRPTARLGLVVLARRVGRPPDELIEGIRRVNTASSLGDNPFWAWVLYGSARKLPLWLEDRELAAARAGLGRIGADLEATRGEPARVDVILSGTRAPTAEDVRRLRPGGQAVWWGDGAAVRPGLRLDAEAGERLTGLDRVGIWGPGRVAIRC